MPKKNDKRKSVQPNAVGSGGPPTPPIKQCGVSDGDGKENTGRTRFLLRISVHSGETWLEVDIGNVHIRVNLSWIKHRIYWVLGVLGILASCG